MRALYLLSLFFITLTTSTPTLSAHVSEELSFTQKRALADLDCVHNIFDVKYAPRFWKQQFAQWDLDSSIETAKNKIKSYSSPSLKECQTVIRDFFNSAKDYHVGVRFYSTETASLPFLIKGAEGRYFVCYVDKDQFSKESFPFDEGDEILLFDKRPIQNVIDELRRSEFGDNTLETDQALAELSLTHRRGDLGQRIPSGKVEIVGKKKGSSREIKLNLTWEYTPEKIKDTAKLNLAIAPQAYLSSSEQREVKKPLSQSPFFQKFMVSSLWDNVYAEEFREMNKHVLGARSSFIPPLGKKLWKAPYEAIFDAYIFETESGEKIGYIRLPHYMGDKEEVEEFGFTMNFFEQMTDALIIDQINNPGGSVFYFYALASTLTDKPLYSPKHRIALTQDEIYEVTVILSRLEQVVDDASAREVIGETVGGYPVDYEFSQLMEKFCRFLIKEWEAGHLYSEPTHLFGVDMIKPHPEYRYTKPILFLINSLDFSGGDFVPAILQDNGRAKLLGTRTAGAGGYVLFVRIPNRSGIKGFVLTGSIAHRMNEEVIENLGVHPEVVYAPTVKDLQGNYEGYRSIILETVDAMIR